MSTCRRVLWMLPRCGTLPFRHEVASSSTGFVARFFVTRILSLGALLRVVRCTRQNDRRVPCTLAYDDHRVELHAIAHGGHLHTLDVIILSIRPHEFGRNVAGE